LPRPGHTSINGLIQAVAGRQRFSDVNAVSAQL
jgi:hypothetical protein